MHLFQSKIFDCTTEWLFTLESNMGVLHLLPSLLYVEKENHVEVSHPALFLSRGKPCVNAMSVKVFDIIFSHGRLLL